ncbi:MAG: hypothetical protein E3K37_12065 [Candidatus Kuenenia sp.]|nr:hypothetical protein [Candidatus Kuenenia hertensis]
METSLDINPFLQIDPANVNSINTLNTVTGQKKIINDDMSIKKVSQDFEAILLNFVVKAMWKTIPKAGLFDGGGGSMQGYTEIMQNALAEDLAAKGGFGVAPVIYNQLKPKNYAPAEVLSKNISASQEKTIRKAESEEYRIKEESSVNFKG